MKSSLFMDRNLKMLTISIKSALSMDRVGTRQADQALGLSFLSLLSGAGRLRCHALNEDQGQC